jgi:serine/threonine protein kinase
VTDRPSWELVPGASVAGDRRVVRTLGGGKRTEVLLIEDWAGNGLAVAKLLRPGAGAGAHDALVAEGRLLARLEHPLFPRLLEARIDEEPACLVLEHVPGDRLSVALRRQGPMPPEAVVELVVELADGIASLAALDHVHLDVKPANTIRSVRPRLTDVGVARTLAEAARVRGTVGSHRFQSPEQHHPARFGGLTAAADVWGIGVTAATALRGRSPWGPLTDAAGERRKLTEADVGRVELPARTPASLVELVRAAMAWEPGDRPPAAELAARVRSL